MDIIETIKNRRSTRAFSEKPVPKELIKHIIEMAINAPSANNLQPWEITVVMDKEKERLSRILLKAYREKHISCSSGAIRPMPQDIRQRGIQTNDEMKVYTNKLRVTLDVFVNEGSCNFYESPTVIIICLDDCFSSRQMVDTGTFAAYFVLAAHASCLGTCPIGLIARVLR